MKKIVIIPEALDDRKKSWRKLLTQVDKTKANGYAFIGEWLCEGERAELEVGSFILCYDETGSRKYTCPVVRLFKVVENGLQEVFYWEGRYGERSWALAVRDDIAAILAEAQKQEPKERSLQIPDEILAELATMQKRFRELYSQYGLCGIGDSDGVHLTSEAFLATFADCNVSDSDHTEKLTTTAYGVTFFCVK